MEHLQSNPIKSGTFFSGAALTASWQFGGWGKGPRKAREQRDALPALPFYLPLVSPLERLCGHLKVFWPRGQFSKFGKMWIFRTCFQYRCKRGGFNYGAIYGIKRR